MPTTEANPLKPAQVPIIVATAAVLDALERVLICQRGPHIPEAYQWEFPGGKVELKESPTQALRRELHEEIGIKVTQSCIAPLTFTEAVTSSGQNLLILLYIIRVYQGTPSAKLGQPMQWVLPQRLNDYAMPAPNQHLVAMLRDLMRT